MNDADVAKTVGGSNKFSATDTDDDKNEDENEDMAADGNVIENDAGDDDDDTVSGVHVLPIAV